MGREGSQKDKEKTNLKSQTPLKRKERERRGEKTTGNQKRKWRGNAAQEKVSKERSMQRQGLTLEIGPSFQVLNKKQVKLPKPIIFGYKMKALRFSGFHICIYMGSSIFPPKQKGSNSSLTCLRLQ